jgi:hypothetical protein
LLYDLTVAEKVKFMDTQLARNLPRAKVRILRRLDGLSERAVDVLEELLECDNAAVRLAAVKEVFDRRFGKARAVAEIKTTAVDMGALHLDALKRLAELGRAPVIDVTPEKASP